MEGSIERMQRVDKITLDLLQGKEIMFELPKSDEGYFIRLELELRRMSVLGGRFIFTRIDEFRMYTLDRPTKLFLVYEDTNKRAHIGMLPKAESIQFPTRPTLNSPIIIWYKEDNLLKSFEIGIGGFRGIYFED